MVIKIQISKRKIIIPDSEGKTLQKVYAHFFRVILGSVVQVGDDEHDKVDKFNIIILSLLHRPVYILMYPKFLNSFT